MELFVNCVSGQATLVVVVRLPCVHQHAVGQAMFMKWNVVQNQLVLRSGQGPAVVSLGLALHPAVQLAGKADHI